MRHLILLAVGVCTAMLATAAEQIVFDTDPLHFTDDGHAAVMLLRSPDKVRILGMTIVAGNSWAAEGAGFMWQTLQTIHRTDIPLYLGAQSPLVHTRAMAQEEARLWGPLEFMAAFERPYTTNTGNAVVQRGSAVDFLVQTVEKNPGTVTIFAIGPMTNIAMALRLHPDLETKIKQIIFMGGNVHVPGNVTRGAEVNFWFDPEAAQVVLRSKIPRKVMFGLDVCNHAVMTRAMFDEIVAAGTPVTELFKDALGNHYPAFLKKTGVTGFIWDCLAAGYLIDPGFVTRSEKLYLDVESSFGNNYGTVRKLDRKLAPDATEVEVMLDLDLPKFFAIYKDLLTRR
ncbi:MAG: nucleoside hydrolase [Bryobacteraceae bacterium]